MVNLEWYRTFKVVYQTGTLTKAAEQLFISQPGVSLHLSSLEHYVGYKLFDRTGRKMIPTERGKVLYNFTIEALSKLEEAEKNFQKSTEKHTPTISLGMCFETFQNALEEFIPSFDFNIILQFGEYPLMIENLEKGIIDLIITPQVLEKEGIEYFPFSTEKIIMVGGNETDLEAFNEVLATNDDEMLEKWLKSQKWYGTTGDMEHLRHFWQLNINKYPDFRPNYIVPNLNSIIRCLKQGQGLAIIPDFLCQQEIDNGNIQLIWEGKSILKNTIHFAHRKKTIYDKEIALIKESIASKMKGIVQ